MSIGLLDACAEAPKPPDAARDLIFPLFEPWIPAAVDARLAALRPGAWRFDLLSPSRMLRLELLQACRPETSFQETLREVWQTWRWAGLRAGALPSSGALADARSRLPPWALAALLQHSASYEPQLPRAAAWPTGRLLTIDSTLLPLPNTPEQRAHFGAGASQSGAAYYPQARALWISTQPHNLLLAEQLQPVRTGDERLAPGLLDPLLRRGDLVLGDAHFGGYAVLATVAARQAFFLCRAPGPLQVKAHGLRRYGPDELDLRLPRTSYIATQYAERSLPEHLELRAVWFTIPAQDPLNGVQRAAFLTNLPRAAFAVPVLAALSALRWTHETLHNDVKTRLGLGSVRSLRPAGVRREVLAHLCVSNVLRLLCAKTPLPAGEASFSAALSALRLANQHLRAQPGQREALLEQVRELIHLQPLCLRPGRSEPRMRRPHKRPYPIFKNPRAEWRAQHKAG